VKEETGWARKMAVMIRMEKKRMLMAGVASVATSKKHHVPIKVWG